MPSPKEVLLANGRIDKIGRGRISGANHEWLKEYVSKGGKVDGYESAVVVNKGGTERLVNKGTLGTEKVIGELFYRYSENTSQVVEKESGKVRSMRDACMRCGVSLLGHSCDSPQIVATNGRGWVDVEVRGL